MDLYLTQHATSGANNLLFQNLGQNLGGGEFENVADISYLSAIADPNIAEAVEMTDYNRDGHLDMAIARAFNTNDIENADKVFNSQKLGLAFNYLSVQIEGVVSNRTGIGAQVTVATSKGPVVQEVTGKSGRKAHRSPVLFFGVGELATVDSIIVTWPSGIVSRLYDVSANQEVLIRELDLALSSVSFEDDDLFVCPGPDSEPIVVTIRLVDNQNNPLVGVPASMISLELTDDADSIVYGSNQPYPIEFCASGSQTLNLMAASPSDINGEIEFSIDRVGGCGEIRATASVGNVEFTNSATTTVRSPDFTGDRTVNFFDNFIYISYLNLGRGYCGDLNGSQTEPPYNVNFHDTFKYLPHLSFAHQCSTPKTAIAKTGVGSSWIGRSPLADIRLVPNTGDIVDVIVQVSDFGKTHMLHIELEYDPGMSFLDWISGDFFSDARVFDLFDRVEDRYLDVYLMPVSGVAGGGSGIAGTARFTSDESYRQARLRSMDVADENYEPHILVAPPSKRTEASSDVALYGNAPNPFNPATSIRFGLERATTVSLDIYDILGREVRTMLDQKSLSAGEHEVVWDGLDDLGLPVSSGVYFYRCSLGQAPPIIGRMTLVR